MAVTNVVNFTGYSTTATGGSRGNGPADLDPQDEKDGFWPLAKCVTAYTTYLDSKRLEIEEQLIARRYRHGAQWNADQIKTFNDRKQPIVTYNKIGQKIDGIVGTVTVGRRCGDAMPRAGVSLGGLDFQPLRGGARSRPRVYMPISVHGGSSNPQRRRSQ